MYAKSRKLFWDHDATTHNTQRGTRSQSAFAAATEGAEMRLELCRSHLEILPEGEADLAYIEDTLGLRKAGNQIPLIRIDYAGGRAALIRLAAGNLDIPQRRRRQSPAENKE